MNIQDCPAWYNGTFCTVKDVNFSVLDLGVIHCDASYDVACSQDRKIFLLDEHLDRFISSCQGLRLPFSLSKQQAKEVVLELCKQSNLQSLLIWMGITRGVPQSGNPRDLTATSPNIFFYVKPYYDFGKTEKPVSLCLAKTLRTPNNSVNQNYKNWSWIDLTSAQWEAADRGFDSAVLLSQQGYVTEGPGFAVWGMKNGAVLSPVEDKLPSVTMIAVERVCHELEIDFMHTKFTADEMLAFDFVSIASTSGGIKQVAKLEDTVYQEHDTFKIIVSRLKEKYNDPDWTTAY
jgi:branched-chain amino acid aminotransferase